MNFPILGEEAVKYLQRAGKIMGRPPRVRIHSMARTTGGIGLFTFKIDWWLEQGKPDGDLCLGTDDVEVFIEGQALPFMCGGPLVLDYESRQDGAGFFFRKKFAELDANEK